MAAPYFAGLWLQNGSVFNSDADVDLDSQVGAGVMLDTLVGPVLVAISVGGGGEWRTTFGVGRIFR